MKSGNGIAVESKVVAKPWSREHLPNGSTGSGHATLKSMRGLENVNRITPDQCLNFAPQGMTIVYGGNGSGKSGYSRVLKRACRARDQSEPVLPDATDPSQVGRIPQASFDLEMAGNPCVVTWALNKPPPDELASIAVFDSKCARAYLTTEGDVAYIPFGLDVVADLGNKVLPTLERKLNAEIGSIDVDQSVLDDLRGDTEAGRFVQAFGHKTANDALLKLATISEQEGRRIDELQKALAIENPVEAARKIRLEAHRLVDLAENVMKARNLVDDEAVAVVKKMTDAHEAALKAVEATAKVLRSSDTLLPGTGEEAWRLMFDAARRFSLEIGCPDHPFPTVTGGSVCPLCQQDLAPAADRLKRVDEFLRQDTAATARQTKSALEETVARTRAASVRFSFDGALAKELLSLDQDLPGAVTGFQKRLTDRHAAILAAAEKRAWSDLPILEGDPREKLRAHAKALGARADALESAADAEKRKALELEHEGLKAKAALKAELPRISRLLGNLKRKHSLEACKKDLKTTAISMKAKSLSEAAVTAALREALDSEFEQLGSVPIELKLADRSDKGKTKYKLQLAVAAGTKLEDVLSEGEQRSIAIGSFLAELALSGHKGGIVFDDPVSSLDHQRKHRIAARLAVEAKERQVIVFTHDLVFLTLLQAELDELGVASASHWLEKDQAGKPGQVRPNDSPANTRTYRDTKLARASIKAAEAKAGEERVKSLRQAAGQLRRTLEEIVPFYLFNDVVARWRENLMLTKLPTVRWENAVADEIGKLFGELSRHVEGHSHTEEYAGGVPELDDLKKFADRVDAVIAAVKKKRT